MIALLLALLAPASAADELNGLPIASVTLTAPRGGLPEESIEALLRASQGVVFERQLVRADLTTLFRIGDFSAVEADADPWVLYDEDGQQRPAVALTYRVYPAPRIDRVQVQGNQAMRRGAVLEAAGLTPGQVFYPALDRAPIEERVLRWYRSRGYVNADVEVDPIQVSAPDEAPTYEVWLRVFEGSPNTLEQLSFVGDLPDELSERTLRRWARRAGLVEGDPVSSEAIQSAQRLLRERLARVTGSPLRPRRGWISARVSPAVSRDERDGAVRVAFAIEPGPRLELEVRGLRWRPGRVVREALDIDERARLTRGFVDEAGERVAGALRRRGFYEAEAAVDLRRGSPNVQTLWVEIDRGPRFTLRSQPPRRSLRFEGNQALSDAELVRVVDQASTDVIRLDYFTRPELERGLAAIRDVYRTRGYQDATLRLTEPIEDVPRGNLLTRPLRRAWATVTGHPPARRLRPHIVVDEGTITLQRGAAIAGAAPDVPVADLDDRLGALAGEPFDPRAVESVQREAIERHRARGYLQADARTRHDPGEDGGVVSVVAVEPGPRVLLRSVVTRGPRRTQPSFIRREVDLTRGAPLSSTDLEATRRRLYELGIFATVDTQLLGDGATRDLLITVQERSRWAAELGGGVNTDQGARVIGRLTRRNLFGRAHRLDGYALLGVDYLSESVTDWRPDLRNVEWRAAISYTAPHLPIYGQQTTFDVLLQERRQELTWRMARTGFGVTVDLPLGDRTTLQGAARVELRDLQEVDARALLPGEAWYALAQRPASAGCYPCRAAESLQAVLLHDGRDDPLRPTAGMLVSGIAELAPGLTARDSLRAPFVKGGLRLSGYLPLGGPILHVGLEGGHARGLGGAVVPLEDRYRLGGTGSLRGFRRQTVGPRNEAERVAVRWPDGIAPLIDITGRDRRTRWIPTGGDTQGLAIAELLLPLPALGLTGWEGYSGALFTDVGNVWHLGAGAPTTASVGASPLIRYSVGAGLRVETPIGPLQLDLAGNPAAALARGERRALLVDAWEEPALRAHLSLGALW